ncbi:MAG: response regulator, partial [Campylobacterota bacterium]|nr:response regulator [Campylobacterota bacterium]
NIISINEGTTVQTLRTVIKKIRKKTYSEIIESKNRVGYRIKSKDEQTNNYIPKMEKHTLLSSKVLILKGNKNKNDTLKYNLEKYGLKCENAYTIKDAKIILEVEDYDYIVVDLDLPDGEGFDFIRDIENLNKTKVIMLSDSTDIHYKEYLYFKGILDYLVDIEDINLLAYNIYKTILKVDMNIKYNNILIIEKSKKICEQFKDILLPRNYNLTILHTTDNAYDIVETTDYSLIIIDLDIKDCYDFLSYVKTNINNSIPFIVLSDTQRNYDIVKEAYRNGASECLRKPIFAEEFILKVDQLVDNSKLLGDINEKLNFMRVYQHAVDQTTIVSKTDLEGKITYANDMFCNISKYNRDELIGQTHSILKHPDNNQDLYKEMWKTIKTDKKIWHGVVKNKAKDGSKYTVDTTIIPIIDSNKNIIEFISLRKADRIDYNIYHIK